MVIGYLLGGNDNDSYIFDTNDKSLPICHQCGYVTNFDYMSPSMQLRVKKYDISSTYDNRTIVSTRFKNYCLDNNYKGMVFRELPRNPGFYLMNINTIIEFDSDRANLIQYKYCEVCGNYESITPGIPVVLKDVDSPLADGFYATNIHFASGNEKGPLFIVGVATYDKLKSQKFKGMNFMKIEL